MHDAGNVVIFLRKAVQRLTRPGEDQIAWLVTEKLPADELALELDPWAGLVPQLVEAGILPLEAEAAIQALDDQLARMSGEQNAALWDDEAIRASAEWATVRALASAALRTLHEPNVGP